jgi:hypothetical protein
VLKRCNFSSFETLVARAFGVLQMESLSTNSREPRSKCMERSLGVQTVEV